MPYWKRAAALQTNIARLRALYGPDLEIVVVDDGSGDCPDVAASVVHLPAKDVALNPSVPFNRGVAAARGDILVLTNPEVVHTRAILGGMLETLTALGPKGYVAAACWSPKAGWWYCHSQLGPRPKERGRGAMPEGSGFHFCSMLRRSLFDEVGGFSEEYRDGQGYEDNDLLWKLHAAGARFAIRDDLVTEHVDCPRTAWPVGGAARNREIFEGKWQHMGV